MWERGGDAAAFSRRFVIIGRVEWGGGGGERTEQTNWGAPHSAPGKRVCAFGRRAARQRRGQTRVGDRRERRGADDSASMLSMQQFPALPAEEERYRQVLSARRVRQARKRPQAACEQGRGARPSPLCSHSLGLGWAAGRTGQCGVESLARGHRERVMVGAVPPEGTRSGPAGGRWPPAPPVAAGAPPPELPVARGERGDGRARGLAAQVGRVAHSPVLASCRDPAPAESAGKTKRAETPVNSSFNISTAAGGAPSPAATGPVGLCESEVGAWPPAGPGP